MFPIEDQQPKPLSEEENLLFTMKLAGSSILPMVFKAVIELDVLEIIARAGPGAHLSPAEITSHLPTRNPDASVLLDRILRLLAAYSVLTCSEITHDDGQVQRLYGLTPICKYFVQNQDGDSLIPLTLLVQDKVFVERWYHLKDAVLEGGVPFKRAHGIGWFEYGETDPRFREIFNRTMSANTQIEMKYILEAYKGFEGVKEVVDVGGGLGEALNIITSKYPAIKGINFDMPHIIQNAPSYPGVKHVGGDILKSIPRGDLIFMKAILHNWNDDHCVMILKNCYEALPKHGKVVLVEGHYPTVTKSTESAKISCHVDLTMMTNFQGAVVRKEKDFEALGKKAGFAVIKVACYTIFQCIVELYKSM